MSDSPMRKSWVLPALTGALLAGCLTALAVGSTKTTPGEVIQRSWNALSGRYQGDTLDTVLFQIRLPRIILAAAVGATLALAGVAAQSLFQNPLAGPHVIGVSNGAALGAVAAMLILVGKADSGASGVALFSLAGGIATTFSVFLLARRGRHLGHALLLTGIALGAFCAALTAGALYLAGERLQSIVFWLMGGLWRTNWHDVELMVPVLVASFTTMRLIAPEMNVAQLGERSARDLGMNVVRLQYILIVAVAIPTAVAVSLTGVIGFVGLVVPHLIRLSLGEDHRRLVPGAALGGAILLVGADTTSRTVAAPAEIPVGILTALIGAPVFLWLLQRQKPHGATA
jgi:iron complex transport system permease protein